MVQKDPELDARIVDFCKRNWSLDRLTSEEDVFEFVRDVKHLLEDSDANPECCNCVSEALAIAFGVIGVEVGDVAGNFDVGGDLVPHGWVVLDSTELPLDFSSEQLLLDGTAGQFSRDVGFDEIEVFTETDVARRRYVY